MKFDSAQCGLWIVDVQSRLFPHIAEKEALIPPSTLLLKAAEIYSLPVVVTEQYPEGLGATIDLITTVLPSSAVTFAKTTFSGYGDLKVRAHIDSLSVKTWILIGIEAPICIWQTTRDLLAANKEVILVEDAIGARSATQMAIAMRELQQLGARVTCAETLIYDAIQDSKASEFKSLLPYIKSYA